MDEEKGFKITRRSLDKLRPADRSERGMWHADSELPGFFVVAYSSGKTTFFVRYRADGLRRTVSIGKYPQVMPEKARARALSILGAASDGEDEAEKRAEAKKQKLAKAGRLTFGHWRVDYVKESAKRLKSVRDPERYLRIAGVEWDARPLAEITTRDVETLRNRIAEKGTGWARHEGAPKKGAARARVGKTQANRFLATLRAALAHAVRLGDLDANPAARVSLLKENAPRVRTLTEAEEGRLRAVVTAHRDPFVKVAFTLLLDTGARLSEVLRARWEDLDLEAGTWRIPSPKSGVPQVIPLLGPTIEVLKTTPQVEENPFVAPGTSRSRPRRDLKKPWSALRDVARIGTDVTIHDLRRTFGLRATLRAGIFAASKLLRHSDSRITEKVYAPLAPADLRRYAEQANVVPLASVKARGKHASTRR